jgi:hypothetical protein
MPEPSFTPDTSQPTAAWGGTIEFAHGRRHSPHLPASRRVVRIDFQNLQVSPNRFAQLPFTS